MFASSGSNFYLSLVEQKNMNKLMANDLKKNKRFYLKDIRSKMMCGINLD